MNTARTLLALLVLLGASALADGEPIEREFFEVDGRPAFVILPGAGKAERDGAVPWVFYAPTFDKKLPSDRDEGWMIRRFLDAGVAVAGVDVGESYGSPAGQKTYDALHAQLVGERGFDRRACLLARSRGGLMLYGWAVNNPGKVRCVAGIYPVCDLSSYPGLAKACGAYGLTEEQLRERLDRHNPIHRLGPLAAAGVPLFHIHGDRDKVVPLDANSGALVARYRELGGEAELVVAEGQWHNMWRGFFECEALVKFVIDNATGR